jgi:hypothetical protein
MYIDHWKRGKIAVMNASWRTDERDAKQIRRAAKLADRYRAGSAIICLMIRKNLFHHSREHIRATVIAS